jgi:hypothetical protein
MAQRQSPLVLQLIPNRHLKLFELSVWHLICPCADGFVFEPNQVHAPGLAAAQALAGLREGFPLAEWAKAVLEILQSLFAEITIRIVGKERAVNLSLLKSFENLFRLFQPMAGGSQQEAGVLQSTGMHLRVCGMCFHALKLPSSAARFKTPSAMSLFNLHLRRRSSSLKAVL